MISRILAMVFCLLASVPAFAQTSRPQANDYTDPATWLCRPGRADACTADMSAMVVNTDGSEHVQIWAADADAPIDCFYVYPTVSREQMPNSDMTITAAEKGVVVQQVARLASKCKIYAPMYRQVTMASLVAVLSGQPFAADGKLAYDDVRDAWNEYLARDNQGRGVVLIGHSQGSKVLTELVKREIDGKPVQKQVVSIILGGASLQVPAGKDVGGDFQSIPLCRSQSQTGCVIAFASFRANSPPPEGSLFGKSDREGMVAACVNPARPGGGSGELESYLPAGTTGFSSQKPVDWVKGGPAIATPFVTLPGLLSAQCVSNEHGSYLAITVHGDPKNPRTGDISGDVIVGGQVRPEWGLHLIDMNLTMGNIVDDVGAQSQAWLAAHPK
jgi:hypothetical protein